MYQFVLKIFFFFASFLKPREDRDEVEVVVNELKVLKSSFDIIKEYSEYATIQGLVYLSLPDQSSFGKFFWTLVIFLMMIMGLCWCIEAYQNWKDQPVLTTITTTAYSVKQVAHLINKYR